VKGGGLGEFSQHVRATIVYNSPAQHQPIVLSHPKFIVGSMSRLSSVVGRTPIADKIKIFDASATVKPRPAHVAPLPAASNKE
jgi:hypothetical protein